MKRAQKEPMPAAAERWLLLNSSRMGDLVCATVVINALRDRLGSLDLLVTEANAPLLRGEPGIEVVTLEGARSRRYDVIVDLTSSSTSRGWIRPIRAHRKIGTARHWSQTLHRFLFYNRVLPKRPHNHIVRDFYTFLRYFRIDGEPTPKLTPGDFPEVRAFLEGLRRGKSSLLGIHVGAGVSKRALPDTLVLSLAEHEIEKGSAVLLLGEEPERMETLLATLKGRAHHRRFPLDQFKTVLAGLDVFVGADSGPLHLAAALGTPVVGIFGPGLASKSLPLSPAAQAVEIELDCRPCLQSEPCPFDRRCYREIPQEDLRRAVERSLLLRS